MKKHILIAIGILALAAAVLSTRAQSADPLPATQTYSNGYSARLALSDDLFNRLMCVRKLQGITNSFNQWITNLTVCKIVLSDEANSYLEQSKRELAVTIIGMGGGTNDAQQLYNIRSVSQQP